jgi:hypothetical protein
MADSPAEGEQREEPRQEGPSREEGPNPVWKRVGVVVGVIVCVVLLFIGIVWLVTRSSRPDVLVKKLRHAGPDAREALIMRLNLARGDIVTPMIEAFGDEDAPPEFRADMLELLFKKNARASDERIVPVLKAALSDPEPVVRRAASHGYAVYLGGADQLAMVGLVTDPDPEVRRQVYMLLGAERRWRRGRGGEGLWDALSDEEQKAEKERLLEDVLVQRKKETERELEELAGSVIGREIESLCDRATEAAQRSELLEAEELIGRALALDPESLHARIRLVRFHLGAGDREKAIGLAEGYGALIRVPLLSEAPVIDGDPSEQVWSEAFASDRFYHATSRWIARRAEGRTELRVGHRDGKVYVAIFAYEDDLDKLVVKHTAHDSDVWRDDCVELFFDPDSSEKDVWQFVINAGGAYFDLFRMRKEENTESEYAAGVFRDRGYWGCEFVVAASAMGDYKIGSESVWGMNIMRTRIGPAAEQQAWWPTYGWSLKFHLYPIAVFEGL